MSSVSVPTEVERTGDNGERHQLQAVLRVRNALVHERLDIFIVDVLLAIGERLEPHEGILELVAGQMIAEFLQLVDESVASGMLAHHQRSLFHANAFGVMIS